MASAKKADAKKVEKLFRDLRQGHAKKREAATKQLAAIDPDGAREALLAVLEQAKKPPVRNVIVRCLHLVADVEVARRIAADPSFTFQPETLPEQVRTALYEDLRRELTSLDVNAIEERLLSLNVLASIDEEEPEEAPRQRESEAYRESLVVLLIDLISDERLTKIRADAARAIRRLDTPAGNEALLARWQAEPIGAHAIDAYAGWVRLGCPKASASVPSGGEDRVMQIHESLIEYFAGASRDENQRVTSSENLNELDELFASGAEHIPDALIGKMMLALGRSKSTLARTKKAVAMRLVDRTPSASGLITLLEDGRYAACHAFAARALVDSGAHGARAVLARSDRIPKAIVAAALSKLPPNETYDFVAPRLEKDESWYGTVTGAKAALRDPRWVDLVAKMDPLTGEGREMLVAIARDTRNDSRARAITTLSAAARRASDRIDKRYALHALGQTGHPNATTALVEALDDPAIGDAVPLICTALGECGDTRAIRVLETRLKGPHRGFVQNAIDAIKSRVTQIHEDVLVAACQDDDPVIADLARQARDGDMDSAIVLEDALRERGRL